MEGPRSPLELRATALAYWCLAAFAAGGAVLWLLRHWLGAAHVPPPEVAALIAVSVQTGLTLLLLVAWPLAAPRTASTAQGELPLVARLEAGALLVTAALLPAGWWWLLGWPDHPRLVGAGVASALVLPATLALLIHGSARLERALLELAETLRRSRSSSPGPGSLFSGSNHAEPFTDRARTEPSALPSEPVAMSAGDPVDGPESESESKSEEQAEAEAGLTQWSSRRIEEGAELIEAWSVAEFARDQRQVNLHFVFVPPFAALPELEVEPLDEADVEAQVEASYRHGARVSVRRSARETLPCRVRIGLSARAEVAPDARGEAAESAVPAPHLAPRLATAPTERRAN